MFFSVITKNSNWKILTKNKDKVGLRMKDVNYDKFINYKEFLGGLLKNLIFRGGSQKTNI